MLYLILVLLGLCFGSFVSLITYRIPKGLGFIIGRSFCDSCHKQLSWRNNIPLFSFLFLGGKSRCCNKKIPIRYPIIEITSAIGFVVLFSLSPIYYILYTISLVILVIDVEHQIIPDELTWLVLLLSLLVPSPYSLFPNLFSGFLFSLLLLTLYLFTSGRGMGLGDVKLAIPLGMILGLERGIYWLMISFIIGGIVASILLLFKKANLKTKIAFGPFLITAFWIILIYEKIYPQ